MTPKDYVMLPSNISNETRGLSCFSKGLRLTYSFNCAQAKRRDASTQGMKINSGGKITQMASHSSSKMFICVIVNGLNPGVSVVRLVWSSVWGYLLKQGTSLMENRKSLVRTFRAEMMQEWHQLCNNSGQVFLTKTKWFSLQGEKKSSHIRNQLKFKSLFSSPALLFMKEHSVFPRYLFKIVQNCEQCSFYLLKESFELLESKLCAATIFRQFLNTVEALWADTLVADSSTYGRLDKISFEL